jgi:hypothetical protein
MFILNFFSENLISLDKAILLKEKGVNLPSLFLYHLDIETSNPNVIMYTDIEEYAPANLYHAYLSTEIINFMPLEIGNAPLKIIKSISGRFPYIVMYTQRWIRHGHSLPDTLVELLEFLLDKGKTALKDINSYGK